MTRAYQEIYLSKAQSVLGDAFDYAVNTCNISGDDFTKLFMASTASRRMENGEPSLLAGKSGIEIAVDVVRETRPAGRSLITSGFQQESSTTFSRRFPLMTFRKCTTHYTKQTFPNSLILQIKELKNISMIQI